MNAPFLIIETGSPVAPLRRHRGFGHWIRVAAGLRGHEAASCHVEQGEALPTAEGWAGVIVSGSSAMVSERLAWSERTADWLRRAHEQGVPLLGICYGHQLIAHAFGGRVDYHPAGREMGTVEMTPLEAASQDPLMRGLPQRFRAQMSHLQSVIEPPPGAVLLARSEHEPHGAFRLGGQTWGVQFHPEFSAGHMRGYILARQPALVQEGRSPAAMLQGVSAAPIARRVLRRFCAHARGAGSQRPG
ncbi:glutamine amidotransferase [Pseudomarimonas salicorniae]|uniref:Glutamine amidotransferase n=1 Tax=Pseudomarimonas salicorniae TaxID=2933270 RepID=A0ABT0GH13_9GAMM|nr:glutamine amidotransferase [Lysobacter sp. CAU 1642]MCK7593642.1 glutamine amidotransferase [Lysobacter sp. CAU 1642]